MRLEEPPVRRGPRAACLHSPHGAKVAYRLLVAYLHLLHKPTARKSRRSGGARAAERQAGDDGDVTRDGRNGTEGAGQETQTRFTGTHLGACRARDIASTRYLGGCQARDI